MTYSEAYQEIQAIVQRLKSDDVPMEELKDQITKAKELIQFCQNQLRSIELDLEEDE